MLSTYQDLSGISKYLSTSITVNGNRVYLSGTFSLTDAVHVDTMILYTPPGAFSGPIFISAFDTSGNDLFAEAISRSPCKTCTVTAV